MNLKTVSFAAVCCVYDDDSWLPLALESVYSSVDAIFVLISGKPWNGPPGNIQGTLNTIAAFPDPQLKLRVVHGSWGSETEQRNAGLKLLEKEGFDYCFIVDADEIYDPVELQRMMEMVSKNPQIACWHMTVLVYWKSVRFRVDPPEGYKPPVFVKIKEGFFRENRLVEAPTRALIPIQVGVCHHMSYARTDAQIKRKITTFSHVHEMQPGWYERVWLGWNKNPQMEDIHPTHPGAYKRAVPVGKNSLPPVLRRVF